MKKLLILLALALFVVLAIGAKTCKGPKIQADINAKANAALQANAGNQLQATTSGRQIHLSGNADSEEQVNTLVAKVEAARGGLDVTHDLKLADVASPFAMTGIKGEDGKINLTGVVANAAMRTQVGDVAAKAFENAEITNELTIARGMPDDQWNGMAAQGLTSLSGLNSGQFTLSDRTATLTGIAEDQATKDTIVSAYSAAVPSGYEATDQISVLPAMVDDYRYSAIKGYNNEITLTGYVPNEEARAAAVAKAGANGATVTDKLEIARGAFDTNWGAVASTGTAQLANLDRGSFTMVAGDVDLRGVASTPDLATASVDTVKGALGDYKGTLNVEAPVPHIAEADYRFGMSRPDTGNLTLDGYVPTGYDVDQMGSYATAKYDGINVTNNLTTGGTAPSADWNANAFGLMDQFGETEASSLNYTTSGLGLDFPEGQEAKLEESKSFFSGFKLPVALGAASLAAVAATATTAETVEEPVVEAKVEVVDTSAADAAAAAEEAKRKAAEFAAILAAKEAATAEEARLAAEAAAAEEARLAAEAAAAEKARMIAIEEAKVAAEAERLRIAAEAEEMRIAAEAAAAEEAKRKAAEFAAIVAAKEAADAAKARKMAIAEAQAVADAERARLAQIEADRKAAEFAAIVAAKEAADKAAADNAARMAAEAAAKQAAEAAAAEKARMVAIAEAQAVADAERARLAQIEADRKAAEFAAIVAAKEAAEAEKARMMAIAEAQAVADAERARLAEIAELAAAKAADPGVNETVEVITIDIPKPVATYQADFGGANAPKAASTMEVVTSPVVKPTETMQLDFSGANAPKAASTMEVVTAPVVKPTETMQLDFSGAKAPKAASSMEVVTAPVAAPAPMVMQVADADFCFRLRNFKGREFKLLRGYQPGADLAGVASYADAAYWRKTVNKLQDGGEAPTTDYVARSLSVIDDFANAKSGWARVCPQTTDIHIWEMAPGRDRDAVEAAILAKGHTGLTLTLPEKPMAVPAPEPEPAPEPVVEEVVPVPAPAPVNMIARGDYCYSLGRNVRNTRTNATGYQEDIHAMKRVNRTGEKYHDVFRSSAKVAGEPPYDDAFAARSSALIYSFRNVKRGWARVCSDTTDIHVFSFNDPEFLFTAAPQIANAKHRNLNLTLPSYIDSCNEALGGKLDQSKLSFETDSSDLTEDGKTYVQSLAGTIGNCVNSGKMVLEIGGHTDPRGSDEYNQALSQARTDAVVQALGDAGVNTKKLFGIGYGEERLVSQETTDEGLAANRRVELNFHKMGVPSRNLTQERKRRTAGVYNLSSCEAALAKTLDQSRITFETSSANLTAGGRAYVQSLGPLVNTCFRLGRLKMKIAGHTDTRGAEDYNKNLSQNRANSVAAALAAVGANRSKLQPVGYGEEQPIADEATEEGLAANRRVELIFCK